MLHCVKKFDYFCNCKSEISNVCNALEGHCLEVTQIVHHYANSRFYWLISDYQSVNPSREAISILSGKYKKIYICPSRGWWYRSIRMAENPINVDRAGNISQSSYVFVTGGGRHQLKKVSFRHILVIIN